jgi:hypothetical protein
MATKAAPPPGQAYPPQKKTLLTKTGDLSDYAGKAVIGLAAFSAYTRTGRFQISTTSVTFSAIGLCAVALGLYLQQEAQK